MDIKCYIAMTASEYANATEIPKNLAWMACHFSLYGTGISNQPEQLPKGSMLILNDRIPPHKHNPERIAEQMNKLINKNKCSYVLLDFQQKDNTETQTLAAYLTKNLSVPVGVSEVYAKELDCPVFLNTPSLRTSLSEIAAGWEGRTLWLEAAKETERIHITEDYCILTPENDIVLPSLYYRNDTFHCKYHIEAANDKATITLQRNSDDLAKMLSTADNMGIKLFVGLYQQLSTQFPHTA